MRVEAHWIRRFAEQLELCGLHAGESAVLLCETGSRPELVETAWLALTASGAACARIVMPTPANPGPLPIRSTGASVAIAGHAPTIAALQHADFVLDCTVEGLLHSPELGSILGADTRILMISNEHPETFERMHHDPGLAGRVARGKALHAGRDDHARHVAGGHRPHGAARRCVLRRLGRLHQPSPATSPTGPGASCSRSRPPAP